jgi:epoxyqueuosine reductase QueG
MSSPLLVQLQERAAAAGLNLCGLVDARRFDACQCPDWRASRLLPDVGTIVVLGSGGSAFWQRMVASQGEPLAPHPRYHPVQDYAMAQVRELAAMLQQHGTATAVVQPEAKATLNFVQLGEAVGFGTVSPVIHILIHPQFGPWVSLRAALLCAGLPFGPVADASIARTWQPCCNCSKPCVAGCPTNVHDGSGNSDFHRCAVHRDAGNCDSGCSVRRACPVGAEYRYGPKEEAHRHAYSLFAMRKWFGLGAWRFVPKFLRR